MSDSIPSPEETGKYVCPACGNKTKFIGIDAAGLPGEGCECGKDAENCTCNVELTQPFDVIAQGNRRVTSAQIEYHDHTGGTVGSEIGTYTKIVCRKCDAIVWVDPAMHPGEKIGKTQ